MNGELKWLIIGGGITVFIIVTILCLMFSVGGSSNTVVTSTPEPKACGSSVKNWIEGRENDFDGLVGFSMSYDNKVILSINQDTAECLGIVEKASSFPYERKLDTGDNYLYINPKNNHFDIMTASELKQLQDTGELCLTADQAWNNVGKKRTCVGFRPTKTVQNSGFIFLNEKHDYVNGFTATIAHDRMISWDDVLAKYSGKQLIVSGTIEEYQNHPEIKIYDLDQIKSPATPYAYSSKYGFVYKSANSRL